MTAPAYAPSSVLPSSNMKLALQQCLIATARRHSYEMADSHVASGSEFARQIGAICPTRITSYREESEYYRIIPFS